MIPQASSNTLNPFIDKIIANPLNFMMAKHSENDEIEKPKGYIYLSKAPQTKRKSSHSSPKSNKHSHLSTEIKHKPKSMAEAVAAYTGKKFLTKKEKKAAKISKKVNDLVDSEAEQNDEDIGEEISHETTGLHAGESDNNSDSEYESASEFHPNDNHSPSSDTESTPLKSPEAEENQTSSNNTVNDESLLKVPIDDDNDDNDDDYDDNDAVDDENSEEEEYLDEQSDDSKEEESSVIDTTSGSKGKSDRRENLKRDLKIDAHIHMSSDKSDPGLQSTSTPPTSPEDNLEKVEKPIAKQEIAKDTDSDDCHPLNLFYDINENPEDQGSNGSLRIYKNWRELQGKKPLGLLNHGVTCYMNSAIQAIIHVPAVQHYLNEIHDGKHEGTLKDKSVSHVLAELSRRMWGLDDTKKKPTNSYINPKKIIQRLDEINCMMSIWQQEDSHEYFMSLISRLQEDSTPKGVKLNQSIIYDIFGGLLNQKVTCSNCSNISETKQEFYDLSLGLHRRKIDSNKYSIENSIKEFFSNELIKVDKKDKSSGYFCETCKKNTSANKVSTIDRAPETLAVHLKRFKFDGNSSSKVKHSISYSKYLDLSKYASENSPIKYRLTSVIVHEGRSISSGHYIAHCLQPDGSWSTYDDEYINKIDEKRALSDPSAYFLIYTKLTPKAMQSNKRAKSGRKNTKRRKQN